MPIFSRVVEKYLVINGTKVPDSMIPATNYDNGAMFE